MINVIFFQWRWMGGRERIHKPGIWNYQRNTPQGKIRFRKSDFCWFFINYTH